MNTFLKSIFFSLFFLLEIANQLILLSFFIPVNLLQSVIWRQKRDEMLVSIGQHHHCGKNVRLW